MECHPPPFLSRGFPPLVLPLLQIVSGERALLLRGCPPLFRPLASHWGNLLPGKGAPLHPLTARGKRALLIGGSPPPPPWWLHKLSARCCLGAPLSSSSSSIWTRVRGARCPSCSSVPVYLLSVPPVPVVSSCCPRSPRALRWLVRPPGLLAPVFNRVNSTRAHAQRYTL